MDRILSRQNRYSNYVLRRDLDMAMRDNARSANKIGEYEAALVELSRQTQENTSKISALELRLSEVTQPVMVGVSKKQCKCSVCHELGHNKVGCPKRKEAARLVGEAL